MSLDLDVWLCTWDSIEQSIVKWFGLHRDFHISTKIKFVFGKIQV